MDNARVDVTMLAMRLGRGVQRAQKWGMAARVVLLLCVAGFVAACGGSSGTSSSSTTTPPAVPAIQNINNSTSPASPVNLPIRINGSGFQSSPGQVVFTQDSSGITATVTPNAGDWTDGGIKVTVPDGDGTTKFTVPGSVKVGVTTSGGSSNDVTLTLAQSLAFNASNLAWKTTTPLPVALGGLSAVAVPISDSSAFVVVAGGNNQVNNMQTVYCNTLAADGTVGPSWTNIPTNQLPAPRAYAAMAEADPSNSLVGTGSRFVYVLGGQASVSDAPGGTSTVYMASVNTNSGAVGSWTPLSSTLPQTLVGPAATIYNGYVYVVGGLNASGDPSPYVYSAAIHSDGTLGTWNASSNSYPMGISFATVFGFSGNLYVLNGDIKSSTTPSEIGTLNTGTTNVNFASVLNGSVGAWNAASATLQQRKKHVTWNVFGHLINGEGVYAASPGSQELEQCTIQSNGTLAAWSGVAAGNSPGANVYNAAAIVSPLASSGSTPRLILLGGQIFSALPTGVASAGVYYNSAP